jgi:hypothetical protein
MPELMNKKKISVFESIIEQKNAEDEFIRHLLPAERIRQTTSLIKLMYDKQLKENKLAKKINFIQS